MSLPSPPLIVSLPLPAKIILLNLLPRMVSSPLPAVTFSINSSVSLPSPLAMPELRSIVTVVYIAE